MTISERKKALRQSMQKERSQLGQLLKVKYDQWICDQLWERIKAQKMQNIHTYLPMGDEINIFPLIQRLLNAKIRLIAPKTLKKRRLQHLVLESLDQVEAGVFGTQHPASGIEYKGTYDLIIVPGLAFDDSNNRLGYGGGYYDRFLQEHPEALKIAVAYPFQLVDRLPVEAHDQPLSDVLINQEFNFPTKL